MVKKGQKVELVVLLQSAWFLKVRQGLVLQALLQLTKPLTEYQRALLMSHCYAIKGCLPISVATTSTIAD